MVCTFPGIVAQYSVSVLRCVHGVLEIVMSLFVMLKSIALVLQHA